MSLKLLLLLLGSFELDIDSYNRVVTLIESKAKKYPANVNPPKAVYSTFEGLASLSAKYATSLRRLKSVILVQSIWR